MATSLGLIIVCHTTYSRFDWPVDAKPNSFNTDVGRGLISCNKARGAELTETVTFPLTKLWIFTQDMLKVRYTNAVKCMSKVPLICYKGK